MSVRNRERPDAAASDVIDRSPVHSRLPQLLTVEEVAELWFGEVGPGGSASPHCQKIRRLIPDVLPARRIGNRWYVSRATAEEWIAGSDPASVMAHPDSRMIEHSRTSGASAWSAE